MILVVVVTITLEGVGYDSSRREETYHTDNGKDNGLSIKLNHQDSLRIGHSPRVYEHGYDDDVGHASLRNPECQGSLQDLRVVQT